MAGQTAREMAGHAGVELSLLQRRFSGEGVTECGRLLSDFFCARSRGGCSYEGRLFVMEKALLFVSTYSSQYDLFVSSVDIGRVTAVHHGFLPSLSLSLKLTTNEEHFTNFHNLGGLVSLLSTLDIPAPVTSAPAPAIQRMVSVPYHPTHHKTSVEPCPFFAKSGFCPRQPLCKLDHTPQLYPSHHRGQPDTISLLGSPSKFVPVSLSKSGNRSGKLPNNLGTPKRFHHMENTEDVPLVSSDDSAFTLDTNQVTTTTTVVPTDTTVVAMATAGVTMTTTKGCVGTSVCVPGYQRSLSLPVSTRRREKKDGELERSVTEKEDSELAKRSQTDPTVLSPSQQETGGGGGERVVSAGMFEGAGVDRAQKRIETEQPLEGSSPPGQAVGNSFTVMSPDVPKMFNFSENSPVKFEESVKEKEAVGEAERGVFMFTASPNKSGGEVVGGVEEEEEEEVRSKPLVRRGAADEGGSRESEEVAVLAQQLQLDSDNDSIHGDLDVEAQRKILDSLSPPSSSGQQPGPSNPETEQQTHPQQSSPVKRRPCVYFLSGFCRNGQSCPDYHGVDFDPSELEDLDSDAVEEQEPAALPTEVKVHSTDHTHLSSGDKIILSPEVLVACEQQQLAYPVAFKLSHAGSGKEVYCGVLQFTAPSSGSAYLPPWMMEHLEASNGDTVSFSHVHLPKGKFVRLQPVSSSWLGIPYDRRMAMMEFQLRNFQTLTEGSRVTLTYELNRYTLKVLECKPAKGISILDADITTDIVEPADLTRYHSVIEGQAEHTSLGEPVQCSMSIGAYRHFVLLSLPGKPLPSCVRVEVKRSKGDPDLFLSQSCTAPTQSRYTWCNQDVGDSCIHLSTDDKDYDADKPLYAGVVSLCEEVDFTICFYDEKPTAFVSRGIGQSSMLTGQTLRDSTHHPEATPTSSSVPHDETDGDSAPPSLPPGHERCPSCGSAMPSLRLVMHQRHCAQSTFRCPLCKAVLPKSAEKKHKYIAHNLLVCACGMEFTQFALHHHQLTDCSKRMVQCPFKWCNLSFPMDQLMSHENLCGRKKVSCPLCPEEVSQLELEIHLEAFHSLDTRQLDWSKPLHSQNLQSHVARQQFSCGCGLGFDFQDDMEVHQLTDCPLRRLSQERPVTTGEIVG